MLLFIRIPREFPTEDVDPSWGLVLQYAHTHHLQFGTDIVFTYGPLGYLAGIWYTGQPFVRLLFDFALDFTIATGVCLLAWRTRVAWRILLLALFVLLPASLRIGYFDGPTETGLFCWTLLCLVETQPRVRAFATILCVLAAVVSLVKFNLFIIAAISIVVVTANFISRGKTHLALAFFLGCFAACLGLWICFGQDPSHFWAYFTNSLAISTGYQSAMGVEFPDHYLWKTAMPTAALALAAILVRLWFTNESKFRRTLILAWLLCFLFLVWKHAFIRGYTDLWVGFLALLAPALEILPMPAARPKTIWAARGLAIASAGLALWMEQYDDPSHFDDFTYRAASRFCINASTLLNPAAYVREMDPYTGENTREQLPLLCQVIGTNSVDIFGQFQAYAWFNHLNYQPRPVFQSYSAYNATLMELNERFYHSNAAPDLVLFNSWALDERFPPLEDARVLCTLLADYTLVAAEPPFLLLKHQTNSVPQMTLLCQGNVSENEPIDLAQYRGSDLRLEITVTPTWQGRLREAFYKPSNVYLDVWSQSRDHQQEFRAPVPMLAAGFLASPVLLENQDAVNLYTGKTITRPAGYAIRFQPGTARMWQPQIQYRLYRIDTKLGRNSTPDPALMKLQ
jgi:hypothetical protein